MSVEETGMEGTGKEAGAEVFPMARYKKVTRYCMAGRSFTPWP